MQALPAMQRESLRRPLCLPKIATRHDNDATTLPLGTLPAFISRLILLTDHIQTSAWFTRCVDILLATRERASGKAADVHCAEDF